MDSSENYCALKRMPILYERTRCLSDGINAIDIFQAHGCWIHAAINTITSLKKMVRYIYLVWKVRQGK